MAHNFIALRQLVAWAVRLAVLGIAVTGQSVPCLNRVGGSPEKRHVDTVAVQLSAVSGPQLPTERLPASGSGLVRPATGPDRPTIFGPGPRELVSRGRAIKSQASGMFSRPLQLPLSLAIGGKETPDIL